MHCTHSKILVGAYASLASPLTRPLLFAKLSLKNAVSQFSFVQCVTIENRQSPFYVVNRVTFAGKKVY